MRKVILHYHLFKNAGTSLDAAFKENFSEKKGEWVTKEFPNQPAANREQVRQWILDNPQAKCFSSHTALFPVPEFDDIEVIPVIFFRHPIDRISSAYSFEKKQGGNNFGPTLARNTTLSGYIETRLSLTHDRQCRNFHSHRLSSNNLTGVSDEISISKETMHSLPFIGLVENYSQSLLKLEELLLENGFESISLKSFTENSSSRVSLSLRDKLLEIERKLGDELYNFLKACNSIDLSLWEDVFKLYNE